MEFVAVRISRIYNGDEGWEEWEKRNWRSDREDGEYDKDGISIVDKEKWKEGDVDLFVR